MNKTDTLLDVLAECILGVRYDPALQRASPTTLAAWLRHQLSLRGIDTCPLPGTNPTVRHFALTNLHEVDLTKPHHFVVEEYHLMRDWARLLQVDGSVAQFATVGEARHYITENRAESEFTIRTIQARPGLPS